MIPATPSSSGPIYLGSKPGKPGFHGLMDDFRIYASALEKDVVDALAV